MTGHDDPVPRHAEAFDRENGGGAGIHGRRGGCNPAFTATQAPIARLEPEGSGDRMRVHYWSRQGRWKDVGDMGGLVMPRDEALAQIASTEISRTWT